MMGVAGIELSKWFDIQLRTTLDGFIWAVRQVPDERIHAVPPVPLGEWSAAQHIFHMLDYEKRLSLPSMYQWLGSPAPLRGEVEPFDPITHSVSEMLAEFQHVRESELSLLSKFAPNDWDLKQQTTFWGEVSLYWLVCKTYQHTLEHTHDILRLSLFWDRVIQRMGRGS